jgi:hypothetical protein
MSLGVHYSMTGFRNGDNNNNNNNVVCLLSGRGSVFGYKPYSVSSVIKINAAVSVVEFECQQMSCG